MSGVSVTAAIHDIQSIQVRHEFEDTFEVHRVAIFVRNTFSGPSIAALHRAFLGCHPRAYIVRRVDRGTASGSRA